MPTSKSAARAADAPAEVAQKRRKLFGSSFESARRAVIKSPPEAI
jgi:hypothetical protein